MSYGNRSKEYDWFKGGSGQGKKSPKENLKTIWKFTRIFLMFSLFFFSMWGCVQVMVIKTDSTVGRGVEFYSSDASVSPHITQFEVHKEDEKNSANQKVGEIYTMSVTNKKENIWLNEKDNKEELAEVNAQMTNRNDADAANDIKLYDAKDGTNEAISILVNGKSHSGSVVHSTKVNGKNHYLALSSISPSYTPIHPSAPVYAPTFDGTTLTDADQIKVWNSDNAIHSLKFEEDTKSAPSGIYRARMLFVRDVVQEFDAITNHRLLAPATYKEWVASNTMIRMIAAYTSAVMPVETTGPHDFKFLYAGGFINHKTNYLPIATWGDAWTRGVGPFYGLFVYPISQLSIAITDAFPIMDGWESFFSMILIVFTLRILAFGVTFKSTLQQTKQQELSAKKAAIDAKYASYGDNKQMKQRKQQEIQALYKKEGISPLGALGSAFITMPIFLSLWRVIGGTQHLKSTHWMGVNFSATSWKELFAGEWAYLPLMLFAAFFAAVQQIYPRLLTNRRNKDRINVHQKAAMKKNNKTQNIIMVVFVVMSLIFSAGLQVYWIIGGVWSIIQTTISHYIIIETQKRRKRNKVKI